MSTDVGDVWTNIKKYFVSESDYLKTGKCSYIAIQNNVLQKLELKMNSLDTTGFWKTYCESLDHFNPGKMGVEMYQIEVSCLPVMIKISETPNKEQIKEIVFQLQCYLTERFVFDSLSDNSNSCIVTQSPEKSETHSTPIKSRKKNKKERSEEDNFSTSTSTQEPANSTTFWFNECRINLDLFKEDHFSNMLYIISKILYGVIENDDGMEILGKDCVADQSIYENVPIYGANNEKFVVAYYGIMEVVLQEYNMKLMVELTSDLLSPTSHSKIQSHSINERTLFTKQIRDNDDKIEYVEMKDSEATGLHWLPLILSVEYRSTMTEQKTEDNCKVKIRAKGYKFECIKIILGNSQGQVLDNNTNTHEFYDMFIGMWSVDRLIDLKYWKFIGAAYYSLENGSRRGLIAWINVLKLALESTDKESFLRGCHLEEICEPIYKTFKLNKVDSKNLGEFARTDSLEAYNEWHHNWTMEALNCGATGSDIGVANVLYRVLWLEVVSTSNGSSPVAFFFQNRKLFRDYRLVNMCNIISTKILQLYFDMKAEVVMGIRDDPNFQLHSEKINKSIDNTIMSLRRSAFVESVAKASCNLFDVRNLNSYIDSDSDLTLLADGYVTVVHGQNIFVRASTMQDYLVSQFDAKYDSTLSWNHQNVQKFLKWCKMLWDDTDLIDFNLKYLASLLRGGNSDKKILYLVGESGNNMKTTWQKFVNSILGDRGVMAPPSFLTAENKTADAATPMAYSMKNARLVTIEEIGNTPMVGRIIKDISGGQKRAIRKNFGDIENVVTEYKVMVVCNFAPATDREGATEERIYINPFISEATHKADDFTEEEQFAKRLFKRNPMFDREFPSMIDAGLWVAVNYWGKYHAEGLRTPPKCVVEATNKYWESVDKYVIFIKECLESDDDEGTLDVLQAYQAFSNWFQSSYKNQPKPSKDDFKKWMSVRLNQEILNGEWADWKIKKKGKRH